MKTFIRALIWNFAKWLFFHHDTGKTNATFLRRGTVKRNEKDLPPSPWHFLPGWQRLVVKLTVAAVFVAIPIWWFTHDATQRFHGIVGVLCLIVMAVWMYTLHHVATRKHYRRVVEPAQEAVSHILREAA